MPPSVAGRSNVSRRTVLVSSALGISSVAGCFDRSERATSVEMAGEWPTYQFDSRNTGYNPDSTGVWDESVDWTRDASWTASLADRDLYVVFDRLERRDRETGDLLSSSEVETTPVPGQATVTADHVLVASNRQLFCFTADGEDFVW